MDEQQLIDRLEAKVVDLPVGPAPIDAMQAAVRRRRSRVSVLAAAAAVAVIAAGTVAWQVAGADPKPPVASDPPAEVDVPPAGHRYVGIGTAVVAVPEDWGTNEATCGTPVEDTVIIDQAVTCLMLVPRPADVDSVTLRPFYEGDDISGWVERDIDGEPALWSPVGVEGDITSGSVYIPSQKATFVAESSSADAQVVVNDLLMSIVMLQEHATVPAFESLAYDMDPKPAVETYTQLLEKLGLAVEVVEKKSPMNQGDVLATDPAVGSVVAPGDTVTVTVSG